MDQKLETKVIKNLKIWDGLEFVDVHTLQRYLPGDIMIRISTEDGQYLDCKRTHPCWIKDDLEDMEENIILAEDTVGKYVLTPNGYKKIVFKEVIEYEGPAYDMTTSSEAYMANNIRTHNSFHCSHAKSLVFTKIGGRILTISLEKLFEKINGNIYIEGGKEYKNVENCEIFDGDWVKLSRICRHKPDSKIIALSDSSQIYICQDNHPIATFLNNNSCSFCGFYKLTKPAKSRKTKTDLDKWRCTKCWKESTLKKVDGNTLRFEEPINLRPNEKYLKYDCSPIKQIQSRIVPKHDPYLVGIFISEGNCTFYKDSPRSVQIHQNPGPIHNKIRSCIEKLKYDYSYRKKSNGEGRTFIIKNRSLAKEFHSFYGRYSYNKALPPNFLEYSEEWLIEFLCAFIEGDGCINRRKIGPEQIIIDTVSFELAQQLYLICLKLGIDTNMLTTSNRAKTLHQGFRVTLNVTDKTKILLKNCIKVESLVRTTKLDRKPSLEGYRLFSYIKPILYTDEYVYDITTETGTVVVSGFLTHNSGGVSQSRGGSSVSRLERLAQLLNLPKNLPGSATLSKVSGTVNSIEKDESLGGHNVFIKSSSGLTKHYVPHYHDVIPSLGAEIKKGDSLSTGPINPNHLLALKDMNHVRKYLADELGAMYKDVGGVRRRNVEVLVRNLTNMTEVVEPGSSDHLPGDILTSSVVEAHNNTVKNPDDKILHKPILKGIKETALIKDEDYLSRMNFQRIQNTLIEAAGKGWRTRTSNSLNPIGPWAASSISSKIPGKAEY